MDSPLNEYGVLPVQHPVNIEIDRLLYDVSEEIGKVLDKLPDRDAAILTYVAPNWLDGFLASYRLIRQHENLKAMRDNNDTTNN